MPDESAEARAFEMRIRIVFLRARCGAAQAWIRSTRDVARFVSETSFLIHGIELKRGEWIDLASIENTLSVLRNAVEKGVQPDSRRHCINIFQIGWFFDQ